MDEQPTSVTGPALPADAVRWLCGDSPRTVAIADRCHGPSIAASLEELDHELRLVEVDDDGVPQLAARSVDVLALATLPEDLAPYAQALRPGGQLAVLSHRRDRRIPWARKLDVALGVEHLEDPSEALACSGLFGFVSDDSFRHWQVVNQHSLAALIRREFADDERCERRLNAALELYHDYGRGNDGMQLPWVSMCWKATVLESVWQPPHGIDEPTVPIALARDQDDAPSPDPADGVPEAARPLFSAPSSDGSDLLLIDFR